MPCRPALSVALLVLVACGEATTMGPVESGVPAMAESACSIGMTDTEARAAIMAMIAHVDALETDGSLSFGLARALRSHLENALDALDRGNYCALVAHLEALRRQTGNLIGAGLLTQEDATPLTGGATDVVEGRDVLTIWADLGGNWEILTMYADGTGVVNLTSHPGLDYPGMWDPDGRRYVFSSERGGTAQIFVVNADGSGLVQLTQLPDPAGNPSWSPDGRRITFEVGTSREIWVMNDDGSEVTRIADDTSPTGWPRWSPDGARIAYHRSRGTDYDVWVINADGTGDVQLSDAPGFDGFAFWSPDGALIGFRSERDGQEEIYVIAPDGSGERRLTSSTDNSSGATFSPDGQRIAFNRCRFFSGCMIYSIGVDGTGEVRLTHDPDLTDFGPRWSPDGSRIAFTRSIDPFPAPRQVMLMNADGSGLIAVTSSAVDAQAVGWRPR